MNLQSLTPEVLRIIGRKAAVPLVVLAVVGGGIMFTTDSLVEENVRLGFMIAATDQEIQETGVRIATIDEELGVIRQKGRRYDQILLTGFTEPQNRLAANQILDQLGRSHDLAMLTFVFEPEKVTEVFGPSGVRFALSTTKVSLEMQAQTDYDLLGFVADFVNKLDGQIQVRSLAVSRTEAIDRDMLQRVAGGSSSGAFSSTVELTWHNIDAFDAADGDGQEGQF